MHESRPAGPLSGRWKRQSVRALAGCLGIVAGVSLLVALRASRAKPVPEEDPRRTFATPYRNVRPEVRYVGDEVCAQCHLEQAEAYHRHPMGRTLARVSQVAAHERYDRAAQNPFTALGAQFRVDRQGERVLHQEIHQDAQGRVVAAVQAEIRFVIGSGTHARSYLIDREGYLFQSPISWFTQKGIWDLSPSFAARHDRFERPVGVECLFCHSNYADAVEHTLNRYRPPIFRGLAIGCERCHGPGELHVAAHTREDLGAGDDLTIVNPGRLTSELREAVCQQCHLEGEARVLRRGRQAFDYRPGLPLELFWSVFVKPPEESDNRVVSSVEQMVASRCYRASGGQLGCISCHDPHRLPEAGERAAYYRERCLRCHQENSCRLALPVRRQKTRADDCTACHMPPVNSSDAPHVAITDHRIPRDPGKLVQAAGPGRSFPGALPLVSFQGNRVDPADQEMARDRGLALMALAGPRLPSPAKVPYGQAALPLLEAAVAARPDDVAAWEGKAFALWLVKRPEEALAASETALRLAPDREVSLADAALLCETLGRRQAARGYWERALAVNPWSSRYRYQRANVLAEQGHWHEAILECRTLLRLNPAHVEARLLLVACYARTGDRDRARAEFTNVLALNPPGAETLGRWFQEQLRGRPRLRSGG